MALVHTATPQPRVLTGDPSTWTEEDIAASERFYALEGQYRHFREFARAMWHVVEPRVPNPTWGRHMDVVCDELQAMFEEGEQRRAKHGAILARHKWDADAAAPEIAEAFADPEPLRLVILVPPRHSKSTLMRLFVLWVWLHRPGHQMLYLSAMDALIETNGVLIRDAVKHDRYQALLRHLVATKRLTPGNPEKGAPEGSPFGMRSDQFAKEKLQNTSDGTWEGHVLGGRFTGVNSDLTIIDDPHDVIEGLSDTSSEESKQRAMKEVTSKYRDQVQDRLNSRIFGMIVLIMQRVHNDDLASFMLAQGARHVVLPARYNPEHPYRYVKDWRTKPGEPLWPAQQPEGVLRQIEESESARSWATKYGLLPTVSDGVLFLRSYFTDEHAYDDDPHLLAKVCDEVVISVDCASKTGARNDYTSMGVIGRAGRRRLVFDRRHFKGEIAEVLDAFDALCREWPEATLKLVEDKSAGSQVIQLRRHTIPGIVPINPKGDKETRHGWVVKDAREGNLYLPKHAAWRADLVDRLVATGSPGAHDDDADMLAQACERWAVGAQPWLTAELRAGLVDTRPALVATTDTLRWERKDQARMRLTGTKGGQTTDVPLSLFVGVVPGWAHGSAGSEACAVIVDERGVLLSVVECRSGGVASFAESLAMELHYWNGEVVAHYAELPGMPAMNTVTELRKLGIQMDGRGPTLSGRSWTKGAYRYPGQRGAGFTGDPIETASLWSSFLGALAHGFARCRDAATLALLETVAEENGLPRMPDKSPIRGRALAFLLAVEASHVSRRAKEPVQERMVVHGGNVTVLPSELTGRG